MTPVRAGSPPVGAHVGAGAGVGVAGAGVAGVVDAGPSGAAATVAVGTTAVTGGTRGTAVGGAVGVDAGAPVGVGVAAGEDDVAGVADADGAAFAFVRAVPPAVASDGDAVEGLLAAAADVDGVVVVPAGLAQPLSSAIAVSEHATRCRAAALNTTLPRPEHSRGVAAGR